MLLERDRRLKSFVEQSAASWPLRLQPQVLCDATRTIPGFNATFGISSGQDVILTVALLFIPQVPGV